MSHRNVEVVLGRLVTDPSLRRRFLEDPLRTLDELCSEGSELTAIEREALASIDADAIRTFADAIDRRIRRADASTEQEQRRKETGDGTH